MYLGFTNEESKEVSYPRLIHLLTSRTKIQTQVIWLNDPQNLLDNWRRGWGWIVSEDLVNMVGILRETVAGRRSSLCPGRYGGIMQPSLTH